MEKLREICYDFEVKQDWWCVSFGEKKNPNEPLKDKSQIQFTYFQKGQELDLIDFYLKNKDSCIFYGYNNAWFDDYCWKAIYYGVNPWKIVHNCIELNKKPWEIEELKFKKNLELKSFDLMRIVGRAAPSLKDLEGNMGLEIVLDENLAKQTGLTQEEKGVTDAYNQHDVFSTMMLMEHLHGELEAYLLLIETFKLPWSALTKTKAGLAEFIFKNDVKPVLNPIEFHYRAPSFIKLKDETIKNQMETFTFEKDNDFTIEFEWDGGTYTIKRGGAHHAIDNYFQEYKNGKVLVTNDFTSFYPGMLANKTNTELRYIDAVLDWKLVRQIIDLRLEAKANGNKKLADALKIIINSMYGKLIDQYSKMYCWPAGLSVCLTGQLITLMICQELKSQGLGKLVQVNTDGFYYELDEKDLDRFNATMKNLEDAIGIDFERHVIRNGKICQKDVNNYILYDADTGSVKVKGDLVKRYNTKQTYISYSTAIIDESIVENLLHGTPVISTMMKAFENNDAKKFQLVYNMKGKNWEGCFYGPTKIQKINRGFASGDKSLPDIRRLKNGTFCKFDDKPEHVLIWNKPLSEIDIRKINLDIDWYVRLAEKGIEQYKGV